MKILIVSYHWTEMMRKGILLTSWGMERVMRMMVVKMRMNRIRLQILRLLQGVGVTKLYRLQSRTNMRNI
jgi:hypothetical protein